MTTSDSYSNSYDGGAYEASTGGAGQSSGGTYRSPQEMKDQAQAKTGEVIDQAKEKTGQVIGQVQEQAKSQVETQKGRAAESLGGVAQALRQTGQQMRDQDNAQVAQFTDTAANQIEKISTFLRERDVNDMVVEVERFARRQPALFIGGALALGLLGARFLRSSGERAMQMQGYDANNTGRMDYYSSQSYRSSYGGNYAGSNPSGSNYASGSYAGSNYSGDGSDSSSGYGVQSDYGATGASGATGGQGSTYDTQAIPYNGPDTEG
ncbi:MAG: hypothetical protein ACJ78Q_10115 [Chloroflexia bacterium]|jgi:hypothetical protein